MRVVLALILMSGVYVKSLRLPQPNMMSKDRTHDSVDESYFAVEKPTQQAVDYKNNNLQQEIYSKLKRYYLDQLRNKQAIPDHEDTEIQKTAYLLIKTMKQRDKRYTSYKSIRKPLKAMYKGQVASKKRAIQKIVDLTLCHFKICNMGRKRNTRYFHMIKTLHDDQNIQSDGHT